jgi:hypothetical protein
MTLSDFRTQVIARLPETASWQFYANPPLFVASHGHAWLTHDWERDLWTVSLDGGTYPQTARSLEDAITNARAVFGPMLANARALDLTPHPQTAPETRGTETA